MVININISYKHKVSKYIVYFDENINISSSALRVRFSLKYNSIYMRTRTSNLQNSDCLFTVRGTVQSSEAVV